MSTSLDLRRLDDGAATPSAAPGRPSDGRRRVRLVASQERAAACSERLRLATDALAAADLLLGLNFSIGSCGANAPGTGTKR